MYAVIMAWKCSQWHFCRYGSSLGLDQLLNKTFYSYHHFVKSAVLKQKCT